MAAATPQHEITLFQLPNSRSLRIAWLLEELGLPYTIVTGSRLPNSNASPEFKALTGGLGKAPTIHDGDLILQESGAIVDYLCEQYQSSTAPLLPPLSAVKERAKVREYVHMAEGTFLLHGTPIVVCGRLPPELGSSAQIQAFRSIVVKKVFDDMAWLEGELKAQKEKVKEKGGEGDGLYLVGTYLTAADIMMGFAAQLIMERIVKVPELGEGREYPCIAEYVQGLQSRKALKMAFQKTGFAG